MLFSEYQDAILPLAATSPNQDPQAFLLMQGAVGLVGELHEVLRDATLPREELGDCWWYGAALCKALDYAYTPAGLRVQDPENTWVRMEWVRMAATAALRLLELAKKVYFQSHPIETHREALILSTKTALDFLCHADADLTETWRVNVAKLQARYPAGAFDAQASLHNR